MTRLWACPGLQGDGASAPVLPCLAVMHKCAENLNAECRAVVPLAPDGTAPRLATECCGKLSRQRTMCHMWIILSFMGPRLRCHTPVAWRASTFVCALLQRHCGDPCEIDTTGMQRSEPPCTSTCWTSTWQVSLKRSKESQRNGSDCCMPPSPLFVPQEETTGIEHVATPGSSRVPCKPAQVSPFPMACDHAAGTH